MSVDPIDAIARTLLYEGYLLYPYRPSAVKNRQRFNFGVLYPQSFVEGSGSVSSVCRPSGDAWYLQAECPVRGDQATRIDVSLRFLQLVQRQTPGDCGGGWHEGVEREISIGRLAAGDQSRTVTFALPVGDEAVNPEVLTGPCVGKPEDDDVICGAVQSVVEESRRGVYRVTVRVSNLSALEPGKTSRNDALSRSLVSTHVVIRAVGGNLISVMDPPDECRDIADECVNIGVFPVLVGSEGSHDCMLASPIILYDYPQIAPESVGDLFDGTEIDEILALRILTMTDDEKREARGADERAGDILDRTERLPPEHFAKLHGALRGLRRVTGERHE